ncbi:MAG: response regulator transcription factor [Chloroflexi bacterium]|nr:response regulator transcription factor [Chloroflexota bacterium]
MDRIRVLLVDDSSAVKNGLQSILQVHSDIEVVGKAADGLEAIASSQQLRPDVILMDVQMPVMDGLEATRRIKDLLPETKILLLIVHPEYVEDALAAGADGFMMKDCGRQELLGEIRELGRQRGAWDERAKSDEKEAG